MRCLNCHTDGVAVNTVTCPGCGVHLPSAHRDLLPPGTQLHGGKYVVEYALGQGGFGITYRSIQVALNRRVAVKEFFPRDQVGRNTAQEHAIIVGISQQERFQRSLQRFQQEALTLAALRHPNVVSVLDIFEERGTAYIVMEYLSGRTLRDEMDDAPGRRLPEERIRQFMNALVDALKAVHAKGIYHLDIKPDNVMVEPDGRIVLIDFGASRQGLTGQTTQAFSPEYAPLEARTNDSNLRVGPGSDIFELGMMLHEMLTGTLPPDAIQRAVDMTQGKNWFPEAVAEPWRSLIASATRVEIAERPSDVSEWWANPVRKEPTPDKVYSGPPVNGEDVHVNVLVTEGVVLVGGHVPLTPPHRDKMAVYIPPGVKSGQELRIAGQGRPGENGGLPGDLLVTVRVNAASSIPGNRPGERPALEGISTGRPGLSTLGVPSSANPTHTVRPVPVGEYRVPIWGPVIGTLTLILLPLGAAVYYAETWVPKSPEPIKKFLTPFLPSSQPKPPKKPSGKKATPKPNASRRNQTSRDTSDAPYANPAPARPVRRYTAEDISGNWVGQLGRFRAAELRITRTNGQQFSGEVSAGETELRIIGSITPNGNVSLRETQVVSYDTSRPGETTPPDATDTTTNEDGTVPEEQPAPGVWHLGRASAKLTPDGRVLNGSGNNGATYRLRFSRS